MAKLPPLLYVRTPAQRKTFMTIALARGLRWLGDNESTQTQRAIDNDGYVAAVAWMGSTNLFFFDNNMAAKNRLVGRMAIQVNSPRQFIDYWLNIKP